MAKTVMEILLIEDSPTDQLLAKEALAEAGFPITLHVVPDGVTAMAFLRCEAPFDRAPRPDLILLDLNLPRKDGREVLAEIKGSEILRQIPVVVLTTSAAERDVENAYDLHANCYISKPVDFVAFKQVIEAIRDFWFVTVRLPARGSSLGRS